MNDFSQFLNDIKQNRESEIRTVISKGYTCSPKNYKFFDTFEIEWLGVNYKMSFFTNNHDTNFLYIEDLIDEESSVVKRRSRYLSMVNLFDEIIKEDKNELLLKATFLSQREYVNLIYKSNIYSLEIPKFNKKEIKRISKRNPKLIILFLVFFLIQNKSNYKFKIANSYCDGIYRFFHIYTKTKYDSKPMLKRGWHYKEYKFVYRTYLEMRVIRLKYTGKEMMEQANNFSKLINSKLSNEEALDVYLKEFNRLNKTFITSKEVDSDKSLFFITSDKISNKKEIEACDSMKAFDNSRNDKCFRVKGIATNINEIVYLFMIYKFNKKYYLTENEVSEIIKSDPSESSINDRS